MPHDSTSLAALGKMAAAAILAVVATAIIAVGQPGMTTGEEASAPLTLPSRQG